MDPFEELWGPSKTAAAGPLTALLGGQLPAGMRNNNPGNIKYFAGLSYPGMVGPSQNRDQGDPQMVFDTPQSGMNAASQLALKKYSGGKRTANDLIAGNMGWTPGNTSAAANVARTMGIGPDDDLGLSDPTRMQSFLRALTLQEQGPPSRAYGDDVYAGVGGGGTPQPATQERAQMDPFEKYWGPTGAGAPVGGNAKPMPVNAGRPDSPGNSMVPGIFGGGDQPGYFGNLMSDPTFLTGASVLSAGLGGQDFGTALGRGAQGAQAQAEMFDKRRKAAAWNKMFPTNGPPNLNAPLLKGLPPDVIPLVAQLGPEEGMNTLVRFAFKRMEPRQLTSVAPGATLYDERGGQAVYTAPMAPEKPPAGFRAAEGGNLEAIPGGPGTQLSGDQAGRLAMMRTARGGLDQAKTFFSDMGVSGYAGKVFNMGKAGEAERTVTTAIEATLRALSGAAAPPAEVQRLEKLFAPTIYDSVDTRADKLKNLEAFINEAEGVLLQGRGGVPQRPPQGMPGATGAPGGQRTDDPLGIL